MVGLVINRLAMPVGLIRTRVLPTILMVASRLVIASRTFVDGRVVAMWYVVFGQAAYMMGRVFVDWRLVMLSRAFVRLPTACMVCGLARILADRPLFVMV